MSNTKYLSNKDVAYNPGTGLTGQLLAPVFVNMTDKTVVAEFSIVSLVGNPPTTGKFDLYRADNVVSPWAAKTVPQVGLSLTDYPDLYINQASVDSTGTRIENIILAPGTGLYANFSALAILVSYQVTAVEQN